ncbi:nitrite/sulfite reductase [Sulfurimonas sp.]|uniref:nitrite/sulfite reductase n=1 Tax=Sulfurimonas sp. TaxID=2022749 RepID=UPI0025D327B3|nr:nitrite/sulfite reductase [Sulfurimonas sp.]MBW6488282.1 nitrite/sulfite reductase [Sulfurimonas sp.]
MSKETKAQRVERIKKEKNGLDVLKDIYRYAKSGEEVDPEDIDRFKWYGLYTQNRNLQDENDNTLYFMLRVKLEGGRLDIKGLEAVEEVSRKYARGTADFTTRQDLQFHFIKVADLPAIFSRLSEAGLTTVFAAGDVARNIVTCPVSDVDRERIYDVEAIVKDVYNYFDANREISNLPRKYKVGISACSKQCASHEIQDLSFNAKKSAKGKVLFDVSIGGGLASNKRIASYIGSIESHQILAVTKAVTEIYRDYGNRENRNRARLGHLLDSLGMEKFVEILHPKIEFTIKKDEAQSYTPYANREHFGAHESIKDARSYIGCAIEGGRIGADGLEKFLKIAKKYDITNIRATATQNFVITDLPSENIHVVEEKLKEMGIDVNPSPFKARMLSCTGMNFCKFAVSETKNLAAKLVEHLEKRFPNFEEKLSFSVNGCPNSCAHPHIVDIGLLGCKVKRNGESVSGFELVLGGNLEGDKSSFGRKTGIKFAADDTFRVVESIVESYQGSHYKNFYDYAYGIIYE